MKPNNGILGERKSPVMRKIKVVAIATGVKGGGGSVSDNKKTGPMAQVALLVWGMSALEALKQGLDRAICGDCRHRGKQVKDPVTKAIKNVGRTCDVLLYKSIETITKKMQGIPCRKGVEGKAYGEGALAPGQPVRLGSYGDCGLVPIKWLEAWTKVATKWTGYTHQWLTMNLDAKKHGRFLMASCDTIEEAEEADRRGWRFFLTVPIGTPLPKTVNGKRVLPCPWSPGAMKSGQEPPTCHDCCLCSGTDGKGSLSIAITAHGQNADNFKWEGGEV